MDRSDRYIVLKLTDLAAATAAGALSPEQREQLQAITEIVDHHRTYANKPLLKAVVVEADWPEYGPTWEAIETRVNGVSRHHGLDTEHIVRFYEHDFYVLSNFSAFSLRWQGRRFDTAEAAYHWEKFPGLRLQDDIQYAPSAHVAFQLAHHAKRSQRPDWDAVKIGIMRNILRAKVDQHPYVRRKLLATGDRTLVEDSWRDSFWGWGPDRQGHNVLGQLWMEIRYALRREPGLHP